MYRNNDQRKNGNNDQRRNGNNGNTALNQAHRDKKKLRDDNIDLERRLRKKTRTITYLERDIDNVKKETAKQIQVVRTEAKESDQLKDELLAFGTKAVQEVRIKIEGLQAEKEKIASLLEAREKNLVELQDAWFNGAPEQTRAAIKSFSERSLELVRNLQADVAAEKAEKEKLLAKQAGWEIWRRETVELRAKSERDNATLQELTRAREEDKRTVKMAEEGKREADQRAKEAKEIAEKQEVVINQLLGGNERDFRELPKKGRC